MTLEVFLLWLPALVLLAGTFGDIYSTNKALATGAEEANPIIRWIMDNIGGGVWMILKVLIAVGAIAYNFTQDFEYNIFLYLGGIVLLVFTVRNLNIARLRTKNKGN